MTERVFDTIFLLWDALKLLIMPVINFLTTPLSGIEIPGISQLIDFLISMLEHVPLIPDNVIEFLSILDGTPIELFFGVGITAFLGYTILTWILNVVT